ncbi:MAG: response regulator [Magnetospirillum sp.]|nr:response regulator [Magnetospirillum sp.]
MQSSIEPFNILLVDDQPGDIELTRMAIAEGRFVCKTAIAKDGVEAMSYLRKEPPFANAVDPDLVLLDLNMPRMNGREVLQAMKADPVLARIPVVVLTTSDVERDVLSSYDLGAAGFVTKPVDVTRLFEAIHGIQDYWFGVVTNPGRLTNE